MDTVIYVRSLMDTDRLKVQLEEIRQLPGNDICCDCSKKDPTWASYNLGIFLCESCVKVHRQLGQHISRVKSVLFDDWDADQLKMMAANGNDRTRLHFERDVPLSYRRPKPNDPTVVIEQWIRGKYERLDFFDGVRYSIGRKEGYLWKKGKAGLRYARRRFVLNETENSLVYFIHDESKSPKATLKLDQLNVTIVPDKVGNPNAMQITTPANGSIRSIFVYTDTGQVYVCVSLANPAVKIAVSGKMRVRWRGLVISLDMLGGRRNEELIEWYTAVRSAKLNRLSVAYPNIDPTELCQQLSRDFIKEGWLQKTGPRPSDVYRRRWVVLDDNILYYYEDPLDPHPKGKVVLGSRDNGFTAREDVPPGFKACPFAFTLKTPKRNYCFSAASEAERREWVDCFLSVIRRLDSRRTNASGLNSRYLTSVLLPS